MLLPPSQELIGMQKIGYARVSTADQSLRLQTMALEAAGCTQIVVDEGVSGRITSRPGLNRVVELLLPGDTLVVWRLDRLGRSLIHLVELVNQFAEDSIDFQSLTENIDTKSSGGRLVFHMMAALAEFERSLISERTKAGMSAVKAEGRHVGRPRALSERERDQALISILQDEEPITEVAMRYQVHPRTLKRLMT
jgi:DNA invertase Pin-like site-specific DNA recombinase